MRQGAWRWAKSAGGGSGAGRGLALGERVVVVVFTGPDVAELWRFHELEGGCCHLRKTIQTSEFGARRGEGGGQQFCVVVALGVRGGGVPLLPEPPTPDHPIHKSLSVRVQLYEYLLKGSDEGLT